MKPVRPAPLHQRAFWAACAASAAIWFLPWLQPLVAPLVVFNTIVHEGAHALAALATGGQVNHIVIEGTTGAGLTETAGGVWWVVVSAGYLGAAALGAWMVGWIRTPSQARQLLWTLCAVFAAATLLWIRGDGLGWGLALLWTIGLGLAARHLNPEGSMFLVAFLGVQQCLQAAQSLLVLGGIAAQGHRMNDAAIMSQGTGLPAVAWAGLWTLLALWALLSAFRRAVGRPG
ncbi:MAG: M50 family metallopeptidase [Fimbriimonadaceae bacterium]